MQRRSSTFTEPSRAPARVRAHVAIAVLAGLALLIAPASARAQACCAASGAVTPGRLAIHEDALVGLQARATHVFGSFDSGGRYATQPPGSSEQGFEQDAIGALRLPVVDHAQIALLVPLVETRRSARGASEVGGGVGDVNFSARYDFVYAGHARYVPGIAALAGVTFPTGRSVDDALADGQKPLATSATGVGAFQGNLGLAIEQLMGSWLVTAYGIVAKRASRTVQGIDTTLGTQWTALVAVAYTFDSGDALALSASYTGEGDAEINGKDSPNSARRVPLVGVSGVLPFGDHFRLQGGLSANPPVPSLGKNQPASLGLSVTAIYAWY